MNSKCGWLNKAVRSADSSAVLLVISQTISSSSYWSFINQLNWIRVTEYSSGQHSFVSTERWHLERAFWVGYLRPFVTFDHLLFNVQLYPTLDYFYLLLLWTFGYSRFSYSIIGYVSRSVFRPTVILCSARRPSDIAIQLFDVWLDDVQ